MLFVDVPAMTRWIRERGPAAIIAGMTDALETDFRRWEQFDKRPRVATHSPCGVIELMPTSDGHLYGFKCVNGHPGNPARGLQTVAAFGVLSDVDTGYPLLLAEMTLLTALRTAATSALATRLLAREDARSLALIGAGSQSEFQTLAVVGERPIEHVTVYDVDPAASATVRRNLAPLGIDVRVAASGEDAVRDADVITTCTADKRTAEVLRAEWIAPGTHVNALGGDCPGKTELDPAVLDLGPVFVEHTEQTRIEGEIQRKAPDFPVTELWQVATGAHPGRDRSGQVTVFDSVGFAIEDFTALAYLLQDVRGTEFARGIQLIAEPEDPRDLFGMVAGVPAI